MKKIFAIAGKELRAYFDSPVAVLFLATFLAVTLFTFFWGEAFFARETADIRPLFEWLPMLLIFLVSSISMRAWSEERKTGTIEILSTLPISTVQLVLGKFLAGMALVSIALVLTLGIPVTVSMMGDLDWGPVWGGYLAALLLSAVYLSFGLAISAMTENGIVALLATAAFCTLLYIPGTETALAWASAQTRTILEAVGVGSRFKSVARGVLDLRDLAYYGGLVAIGITANNLILTSKRWSLGDKASPLRRSAWLTMAFVIANVVLLGAWLHPVQSARADLTEDGVYSLSDTTKNIVSELEEPLVLKGYFSDKTHPILAPLVPQISDILDEYQAMGDGVEVTVVDPTNDPELEKEAFERYSIKTMPVDFEDKYQVSTLNAYFQVVVAYGDEHKVLDYRDLLDMQTASLKDMEYTLTKTIRKVVTDFQSKGTLLKTLTDEVKLTAFVTPENVPENWKSVPSEVEKIAAAMSEESNGKFSFAKVSPTSPEEQKAIYEEWGIKPYVTSIFGGDAFYMHLAMTVGDRNALLALPEQPTEETLKKAIESGIERLSPGFATVVGFVVPEAKPNPPGRPGMPQQPPRPEQAFQTLKQVVGNERDVEDVTLSSGKVPDNVEVLLILGKTEMTEVEQKAVDQFLMQGGSVVVLAGSHRLNRSGQELSIEKVNGGLFELLKKWGVTIGEKVVYDKESDVFPVPVTRNVGGLELQEIQRMPFAPFVKVKSSSSESPVTKGLGPVITHFVSPLELQDKEGIEKTQMLASSEGAWLSDKSSIQPDFDRYPELGFEKVGDEATVDDENGSPKSSAKSPYTLAFALRGSFKSAFAKEQTEESTPPSPKDDGANEKPTGEESKKEQPLLGSSPNDARLVVVGSSDFVSDTVLAVSQQARSMGVENNLNFVQNILDWSTMDAELLSIRARSGTVRPLENVEVSERFGWEMKNYLIAFFGLAGVLLFMRFRRKAREVKLGAFFRDQKKHAKAQGEA